MSQYYHLLLYTKSVSEKPIFDYCLPSAGQCADSLVCATDGMCRCPDTQYYNGTNCVDSEYINYKLYV